MADRIVYLMRGLPSCGKSFTARKLAGPTGIVCETDEYFLTQIGDDPTRYDYDAGLLEQARQWNYCRFAEAVLAGRHPIVVDRGNGLNAESRRHAWLAVTNGYGVELAEPESEWWQEIRVLLKYKDATGPILDTWAERLANKNHSTHRTPASTIRRWMAKWRHDLTAEEILNYRAAGDKTSTPPLTAPLTPPIGR